MNFTTDTPHTGTFDNAPEGGPIPMVGLFGVEVEAPQAPATKGSPVSRYDWADTFALAHQTGPVARAVLVHFAHRGGITYNAAAEVVSMHRVWEARETTAAHLQYKRRVITKAINLLVQLKGLIPDGKRKNLNGKLTEVYALAGMYTEWQVPSKAQADAVEVVRQAAVETPEETPVLVSDVHKEHVSDVHYEHPNKEAINVVEPVNTINSDLINSAAGPGPTAEPEILETSDTLYLSSLGVPGARQTEERTCTHCGQPLPAVDPSNSASDPEIANTCIFCVAIQTKAIADQERKARGEGYEQRLLDAARHRRTTMTSTGLREREIGE